MQMTRTLFTALMMIVLLGSSPALAQVDEDQAGAWYMYFFNAGFEDSRWGLQGDLQHRNWDLGGDLEQLLLRGGLTFSPTSTNLLLTLGYANITSGHFGSSSSISSEDRAYQEALLPHTLGQRVYLRHRFRFEQRWVDGQDFRTRFRYALFVDVPLNRANLRQGAVYLSAYNEVFVNGQRAIGDKRRVETFDRNRLYAALGYSLSDSLRLQGGYMHQGSAAVSKGQFQLSLHQSFQ